MESKTLRSKVRLSVANFQVLKLNSVVHSGESVWNVRDLCSKPD